ncbi:MAG TPA: hypothetical protein VGB07_34525 [Blastocatellia bacterium]|jgi:hypothetical protein
MQHSAEIRWFVAGALTPEVHDWFCQGQTLEPEERTDRYLVFPGCESVGVKIRDGGATGKDPFEIKALKGASETIQLPNSVSGRTDCWVKWSNSHPANQAWLEALRAEPAGWLAVAKKRWVRKFALNQNVIEEVPNQQRPAEGCNVELTALEADGQAWWSFAFEAFGEPDGVRGNLRSIAIRFLSSQAPLTRFTVANSGSYAVWLANFPLTTQPK